jgi:hypothetical protein
MLEARVHPLVVITLRFIQLMVPLLLLKLMGQSKRGVTQIMELPHALIDPSALRAAKAYPVE